MMAMSAEVALICIIGFLSIVSVDARRFLSRKTKLDAKKIPADCSECGITIPNRQQTVLIVRGGTSVNKSTTYPWMVSLRADKDYNRCNGAIIDKFHVLTAAHCFENTPEKLKVYFQTEDLKELSRGYAIEQIIKHSQFSINESETGEVGFSQYDIALVRLKEQIKCDEYKNPICLPDAGFKLSPGSKSIIAGWGSTTGKRSQSEELQQGYTKNLDFNKCIKEIPETKQIKDFLLCQGSTKSSPCYVHLERKWTVKIPKACYSNYSKNSRLLYFTISEKKGDSGAPLMHKIKQKYYAIGITSSTTNIRCSPERPAIYTDVVKYLDWIKKKKKASLLQERKRNGKPKTCEEMEIEKRREQHRKEEGK